VERKLTARVLGQRGELFEREELFVRLKRNRTSGASSSSACNGAKNGSRNSRRLNHLAMLGA
jgi:hypothetical protein